MDSTKDRSIHFKAQKVSEDIQNMTLYKNFYTDLQVNFFSNNLASSSTQTPNCYFLLFSF